MGNIRKTWLSLGSCLLIASLVMGSLSGCSSKQEKQETETNHQVKVEKEIKEEGGNGTVEIEITDAATQAAQKSQEDQDNQAIENQSPVDSVLEEVTYSKGVLSNPNASEETKKIYRYLTDTYGTAILSAQQESTWMGSPEYEMDYIKEATGKLPAIRGLDYINEDFAGVNRRAMEWWEQGGLVSICWHWGMPPKGVGYESSKGKIDLKEALTEGTPLYEGMIAQMDEVAGYLSKLQEEGVVVLWRPFHEFDGAWFWWGKGGSAKFIELWKLMYDRYTNVWGLNNLIWVLGYSDKVKSNWYPGDAYVDIAGADTYSSGSQVRLYDKVKDIVGEERPIALHECGYLPDPDLLASVGENWLWFLVWHTSHLTKDNSKEELSKVYNHEYVITLDELPDFNEY